MALVKGDKNIHITFRASPEDYKVLLPTIESIISSITIPADLPPLTDKTGTDILTALRNPPQLTEKTGTDILTSLRNPPQLTEKTGTDILTALKTHVLSEDTGHEILNILQQTGSPITIDKPRKCSDASIALNDAMDGLGFSWFLLKSRIPSVSYYPLSKFQE